MRGRNLVAVALLCGTSLLGACTGVVDRRGFLADGRPIGLWPGLRATQAIYSFRVR